MKRTLLTLLVLAALLVAWRSWPRHESSPPALERTSEELPSESRDVPAPLEANVVEIAEETRTSLPTVAPIPPTDKLARAIEAQMLESMSRGAVEGIVVRRSSGQDAPIEGAEIALLEEPIERLIDPTGPPALTAITAARTTSDRDGKFSFAKTDRGRLRLRARLQSGETFDCCTARQSGSAPRKVRIVFGGGTIEGVVHKTSGEVQREIIVRLARSSGQEEEGAESWQLTDEAGHYRFSGLPADAYELLVGAAARNAVIDQSGRLKTIESWPNRVVTVQLAEGDTFVIDAGTAQGARRWSGRIRTPSGELYAPGKDLVLEHEARSPRGSKATTRVTRKTLKETGIDQWVDTGVWSVKVEFAPGDVWEMENSLTVANADLELDLVVPGTRVIGRAFDAETGRAPSIAGKRQHMHLKRFGKSEDKDPDHEAEVQMDGSFTVLLRGGGDWVLKTDPLPLSEGRKRMDLSIDPGLTIHRIDVQLGRP